VSDHGEAAGRRLSEVRGDDRSNKLIGTHLFAR
jgi:hypothetical protein